MAQNSLQNSLSILMVFCLISLHQSCKKSNDIQPCDDFYAQNFPKVNTIDFLKVGGRIQFDYEIEKLGHEDVDSVEVSGICFSTTNKEPTIEDKKRALLDSNVLGKKAITILESILGDETWYYRAFATNCAGTSYGKVYIYSRLSRILKQIESNMVRINGGSIGMGCTSEQSDCDQDEFPPHLIELSDFYIGKFEVTQSEWKVLKAPSSIRLFKDDFPMDFISWSDIQVFLEKLNFYSGKTYRMPTEAEWEFAARGGNNSEGYLYSGSNVLAAVGWHSINSTKQSHEVGLKDPNELGLYDMSGNVYEWCSDWYSESYFLESPVKDPKGPSMGLKKVYRGGAYNRERRYQRVANRFGARTNLRADEVGFRLALSPL